MKLSTGEKDALCRGLIKSGGVGEKLVWATAAEAAAKAVEDEEFRRAFGRARQAQEGKLVTLERSNGKRVLFSEMSVPQQHRHMLNTLKKTLRSFYNSPK